jgi:hypothetical protein
MITIRGQDIPLSPPLTKFEFRRVSNAYVALGRCTREVEVRLPENFVHLVRVVTCFARRQIPDVTLTEVSAAINPNNFIQILQAFEDPEIRAAIIKQRGAV